MKDPQGFFKVYDDYCFFQNPKNGFSLMTQDEFYEYNQQLLEEEGEQYAESAWLRHAESASLDDYGFEEWERNRGCH